jgi:DNA-directed RNA polymerase specialized sigma24 family protein
MKTKDKPHYVNNKDFSLAVVQYCEQVQWCKEHGKKPPVVSNYIAECFLKIAEGLSHKANFVRYTYREEMVMDAVENCLKAIENYNIEAATRTGTPNAFAYFTQIAWYAFLRRINREKKQQEIKLKYISEAGIEDFIEVSDDDPDWSNVVPFVDVLRHRIDQVKDADEEFKEYVKEYKRRRRAIKADSDLSEFLVD